MGEGIFDGPVNAVLLAAGEAGGLDAAVLCNSAAWLSRDGGASWSPILAELSAAGRDHRAARAAGLRPRQPDLGGAGGGKSGEGKFVNNKTEGSRPRF